MRVQWQAQRRDEHLQPNLHLIGHGKVDFRDNNGEV